MWLSKKIEKDPEAKIALKELSKLIKGYSDATKIAEGWYVNIYRIFKPRLFLYPVIIIFIGFVLFSSSLDQSFIEDLVKAGLSISIPIFVLGITLASAVKNLDKESKFATEYLHESCRFKEFTYLAFLTVIMGFFFYLANNTDCNYTHIVPSLICTKTHIVLASIATGGAIWCLWSLVFIIVETTKCMSPEYSTKAASTYAARKLIHVFMKKTYLDVWMGKHSELLELEIKSLTNIRPPHECFALHMDNESTEKKHSIKFAKKVDLGLFI